MNGHTIGFQLEMKVLVVCLQGLSVHQEVLSVPPAQKFQIEYFLSLKKRFCPNTIDKTHRDSQALIWGKKVRAIFKR